VKKGAKKAGETAVNGVLSGGVSYNNYIMKCGGMLLGIIMSDEGIGAWKYLCGNEMVRNVLLFLIIFMVLPRGIPEDKSNRNKNIVYAYPVLK
jgi:hypothetical protein